MHRYRFRYSDDCYIIGLDSHTQSIAVASFDGDRFKTVSHVAEPMKILWGSEQPTRPTGYATVTREIIRRLCERGHEVYVLGWDYNGEDFQHEEGWTMVHSGISGFGSERLNASTNSPTALDVALQRIKPDVYVSLIDPWYISHAVASTNRAKVPYLAYMPIDGYPVSREWADILKLLHTPVWMSNFGREKFNEFVDTWKSEGTGLLEMRDPVLDRYEGIETPVIYHGVDTSVFKPHSKEDGDGLKKRLGITHWDTVFLSVGRNCNRKQQPRLIEAFGKMLEQHPDPDSVGLIIHCGDPTDSFNMGGWNLPNLIHMQGLHRNVTFSDMSSNPLMGLSREDLALLYSMCDVHVLATGGEGFGIPTVEAMACGLPVILPDNSTGPELIGDNERGLLVKQSTHITGPMYGVNLGIVDIDDLADKMLTLAIDCDLRQRLGDAAREWAKENCDWDDLTTQFETLFESVVERPHPLGNNAVVLLN